jgi:hypothetical protein
MLYERRERTYASLLTAISTGTSPGWRAVTERREARVDRMIADRMVKAL